MAPPETAAANHFRLFCNTDHKLMQVYMRRQRQQRPDGEAFWAMCAADSMSMPVHWYYHIQDIKRDFGGWISGFSSPADRHPSSILTLSNTAGSGRTAWSTRTKRTDVVGDIILHNKLDLWKSSNGSVHYHQAAQTLIAGRFADVSQPEARAAVLSDYVQFLTKPGSHADTYAESFHRSFFCDWRDGRLMSPHEVLVFAETRSRQMLSSPFPDSQLDAIGCLPMILPFVLLSASANEEQAVCAAVDFVKLTHPHPSVPGYVLIYSRALHAVVGGASIRQQAEIALRALGTWDTCQSFSHKAARFSDCSEERLKVHQSAVNHLGLACYTRGALSSLFYLAHEFHDDIRGGILTNTNCGGENCNRGAALGALLGAGATHEGLGVPLEWKDKLRDAREFLPNILKEVH
uniref:ADP-ribosylhydrolase like 1 n=1 Tax=Iconisemion striatum TaxID=60296 RepID=A0A1A7X0H9_9TELE